MTKTRDSIIDYDVPSGLLLVQKGNETVMYLIHYDKSNCEEINTYLHPYESIHISNDTFLSNGSLDDLSVEARKGDIFIYLSNNEFKKVYSHEKENKEMINIISNQSPVFVNKDCNQCEEIDKYLNCFDLIYITSDTFLLNGTIEAKAGDIFMYLGNGEYEKVYIKKRRIKL